MMYMGVKPLIIFHWIGEGGRNCLENAFPIVDFDEMCEKISVKTGISLEDVITVLDAESEYLVSLGIVAVEDHPSE